MVVLPGVIAVATPELLIVAAALFVEDHIAEPVRFCELPLLYVPIAVYCNMVPLAIAVFAGVMFIEVRTGVVTIRPVELATEFIVAPIVAAPVATVVANPDALIVATPGFVEVHVTEFVRFCCELSLK